MTYISLNNHTNFSLGTATIRPKELIEKAKELGQEAVAVTDYGTMAGMWDSYNAAKKAGIKFIPGCTFNFVDSVQDKDNYNIRNLVIIARNAQGYKNLLGLSKAGFDNYIVAFKKATPRIDWNLLQQFHEGLICFAGTPNGVVSNPIMDNDLDKAKQEIKRLQEIFGDYFALELQPHNMQRRKSNYSHAVNQQKINLALKKLAEELGVRCIVATNVHYLEKEHADDQDVLICIHSGQPKTSGQRLYFDKPEFYVKSEEEVRGYFERHKKAWGEEFIESLFVNTKHFSDLCDNASYVDPVVATGQKSQLPDFPIQDEEDYQDFLEWKKSNTVEGLADDALFYRYRSYKGLEERIRKGHIPEEDRDECMKQLLEEFDVFEYRGFSSYMLIVADFLNWARRDGISIGPGRGSVASSLSAYCNNIHQAYPKRYGLIFARFINKHKVAYPDVDSDVSPAKRHLIYKYLQKKYGTDMTSHVSNINTVTPKVYARDISRVFEFGGEGRSAAVEIGNNIADSVPGDVKTAEKALKDAPLFAEYAKIYPELERFAKVVGGQPRAWSTHAGGVIVSKAPLAEIVPLRRDTQNNIVLEYEKNRTEDNHLVKLDLLGLSTLDVIQLTYQLIKEMGVELSDEDFNYEMYDEKTYDLISKGDTFCIFQLGDTAVPVCKMIKPKCIDDIAFITSLVRPAAKDIVEDFIKVRSGEKPMEIAHPAYKDAFEFTYGFPLYEESLMLLAQSFGWNLSQADNLRKLTKEKGKNPEKVKKWKAEFIESGVNVKGFDKEFVEDTWDMIERYAKYAFNRSHATTYSFVSYHQAWLKANHRLPFLVSNLMHEINSNAKKAKNDIIKIKNELRAMGVTIVPPDINKSDRTYKIIDDHTLMAGLDSLKYMGSDAIPEILAKRPFTSFADLIQRTDSKTVRAQSIQALAASGGLDSFGLDRKLMFYYASDYRAKLRAHMNKLPKKWERTIKAIAKEKSKEIRDVPSVPDEFRQEHINEFSYPFPNEVPWNVRERFAMEEYFMGEGISGTVFERYSGFFQSNTIRFTDLPKIRPYRNVSDDEKLDRYGNRHELWQMGTKGIKAIISTVFSFTVKKEDSKIFGQEMARCTLLDPWNNEITMICFPDAWAEVQERIKLLTKGKYKFEPGVALHLNGQFQWENSHTYSIILGEVISCKAPPALPEDLKSRKVRLPRSKQKKITKEEILNFSQEEFVEVLEDIMVEDGAASVDDDDDNFDPFVGN